MRCDRARVVGIVNANPDSFSDGGVSAGTDRAVAHGLALAAAGADVIEVGGESLRFSAHTPTRVEIDRVVPVIEALVAQCQVPVAVDTFKAPVAIAAIAAGAAVVNDPTGLREPAMLEAVASSRAGVVMTHFFGPPKVRPSGYPHTDVVDTICAWLAAQMERAERAGLDRQRVVVDPGLGLGLAPRQDLELLRRIDRVVGVGRPVLVPISQKKLLGTLTGAEAGRRQAETQAGIAWCRARGARLFRVHNVAAARATLTVTEALLGDLPVRWHAVVK